MRPIIKFIIPLVQSHVERIRDERADQLQRIDRPMQRSHIGYLSIGAMTVCTDRIGRIESPPRESLAAVVDIRLSSNNR